MSRAASSELGIIGIPTNSSGAPDGVAPAPKVLRQAGLTGEKYHSLSFGELLRNDLGQRRGGRWAGRVMTRSTTGYSAVALCWLNAWGASVPRARCP